MNDNKRKDWKKKEKIWTKPNVNVNENTVFIKENDGVRSKIKQEKNHERKKTNEKIVICKNDVNMKKKISFRLEKGKKKKIICKWKIQ